MKNEKEQRKGKNVLQLRSYGLSLQIINLLETLPRNYIYQTLGKQLLRSATSVGANIVEAQAGRTRRDFTNFYHIALKSANETKYWLALLSEKTRETSNKQKINLLLNEITEISKMLGASLLTLKGKRSF